MEVHVPFQEIRLVARAQTVQAADIVSITFSFIVSFVSLLTPRGGTPIKYDGGGEEKVELNPKPIKIQILGQFGTQKNTYISNMAP